MGLNILLVENDPVTADLLLPALLNNGHAVAVIGAQHQVMSHIRAEWPDLLVVDVLSYGADGPAFYQNLRPQLIGLPVILFLPDGAGWLAQQAEESLTPPFTARKLLHRVRKLAARQVMCQVHKGDLGVRAVVYPQQAWDTWLKGRMLLGDLPLGVNLPVVQPGYVAVVESLTQGRLVLNLRSNRVELGGKQEHLRPKEALLLAVLMCNAREVVSRKTLMKLVWETDFVGDTRTLNVHVRWLREKIEPDPSRPVYLRTVRGVGYRFEIPPTP